MEIITTIKSDDFVCLKKYVEYKINDIVSIFGNKPYDIIYKITPAKIDSITGKILVNSRYIAEVVVFLDEKEFAKYQESGISK